MSRSTRVPARRTERFALMVCPSVPSRPSTLTRPSKTCSSTLSWWLGASIPNAVPRSTMRWCGVSTVNPLPCSVGTRKKPRPWFSCRVRSSTSVMSAGASMIALTLCGSSSSTTPCSRIIRDPVVMEWPTGLSTLPVWLSRKMEFGAARKSASGGVVSGTSLIHKTTAEINSTAAAAISEVLINRRRSRARSSSTGTTDTFCRPDFEAPSSSRALCRVAS